VKLAALLLAFMLAGGIAWRAGELHRRNCIEAHLAGCSVLPWVSGHRQGFDFKSAGSGWGTPGSSDGWGPNP
jgi:hypothetical protein